MKTFLLPLLALAGLASAETLPVDRDAWRGMNRQVDVYKERNAPAPVERRVVDSLWRRLAQSGAEGETPEGERIRMFERSVQPDAAGVAKNRLVYVVELPETADAAPVQRALYTRSFSHMVASSEDWSRAPDGAGRVEIWRFTLDLSGVLVAAVRQEITLKNASDGARGQTEPDPARSRTVKLRPSDPVVLQRWKELSRELLLMGPTIEI